MSNRRGFLKGFGLVGTVLAGASAGYTAAKIATANSTVQEVVKEEIKEDITHLAPVYNTNTLVLSGDNRPPKPPEVNNSISNALSNFSIGEDTYACNISSSRISFINTCPQEELNKVTMAVGKDDRLWIKVGSGWKRVVVEG